MSLEELLGKYLRLQADLQSALAAPQPRPGHVDRIAAELAALERTLASLQPADEQTSELLPFPMF